MVVSVCILDVDTREEPMKESKQTEVEMEVVGNLLMVEAAS